MATNNNKQTRWTAREIWQTGFAIALFLFLVLVGIYTVLGAATMPITPLR